MSKASALGRLQQAGFPIPAFVVIPEGIFDAFRSRLPAGPAAEVIQQAHLPEPVAAQILELARPLGEGAVAVRSSMEGEDSARHSFAGQLDSFLNVRGEHAILSAVKACWASAYGPRAAEYRRQHGLPDAEIAMEVIVQEMVPAQVSGVIFTADPVARDPRWMLISAAPGLGDALVQGRLAGETWRISHETGAIESGGKSLSNAQIRELVRLAKGIEALFEAPQDIEFAWAAGKAWILQARPITGPVLLERILWDNANITESYSGTTTPLTFSVIRSAYAQVYRQFLALMGVRRMKEGVLRNLLGFYEGQVYYQLLNWYAALAWLPAFEQNRRFMELMMGVKQSAGQQTPGRAGGRMALLRWGLRLTILQVDSQRRVKEFLRDFNAILSEYNAKDFASFTPRQLHAAYQDLQGRVLGRWQAPLLTDFLAMIFFGALRGLRQRWLPGDDGLHNDLLAGDGMIESLEPARRVQELAGLVRANPALREAFERVPEETLQAVRTRPEFEEFLAEFNDYLLRYGDRCMNELKLEEPNLRDDPRRLIRLIASAADAPAGVSAPGGLRTEAEAQVARLPLGRRIIFSWILGNARRHIRNRENLRFARTRLFGLLRGILNALGRDWAEARILREAGDIYFLAIEEIWDFIEGTAVTQNLQSLVDLRRHEYSRQRSTPLPDRFETFGLPYLDSPHDLQSSLPSDGETLHGTGCCSGQVRAPARVVKSVDGAGSLGGDILVAERTDPGWIFLFPSASGILVERGSPLSHSAIVAREMGKPIIVNIPGLTLRVKTGDELHMDGGQGSVRLISR